MLLAFKPTLATRVARVTFKRLCYRDVINKTKNNKRMAQLQKDKQIESPKENEWQFFSSASPLLFSTGGSIATPQLPILWSCLVSIFSSSSSYAGCSSHSPQQYANKHFESTLTHNNTCNYINQYNNIINNTKGSLGAIEHIGSP